MSPQAWKLFSHHRPRSASDGAGVLENLQFSGTFIRHGKATERIALINDLKTRRQHLVKEGGRIDDVRVTRVSRDQVVCVRDGEEVILERLFATANDRSRRAAADAAPAAVETGDVMSFGRRVGENRWVYERDKLRAYYDEMMEQPVRVAALFDSFDPIYNDERKITGYELNIKGEADFIDAVGLREDDVVRKVNGLAMTSKSRAEHFIRQFYLDKSDAFVIEIERGGQPQRLVYMVR